MADELKAFGRQLGGWLRNAAKAAETVGTELQRQAPSLEQVKGYAGTAMAKATRGLEEIARAAEEAGILPGTFKPSAEPRKPVFWPELERPAGPSPIAPSPKRAQPTFELASADSRITARLTPVDDTTLHALVTQTLLGQVRLTLRADGAAFAGSAVATDGTVVTLRLEAGRCATCFGTSTATLTPLAASAVDYCVRFGVDRRAELEAHVTLLEAGPLSDAQRDAVKALLEGPVSQRGASVALASSIAARSDLTVAQAAQMPLLHAWVAADATFDSTRLIGLAETGLASPLLTPAVRAFGTKVIAAAKALPESTPDAVRWTVALTGVLGAVSCDGERSFPEFRALIDGAATAMRLLSDGNIRASNIVDLQAQAWHAIAQLLVRSLPDGDPTRIAIADIHRQVQGQRSEAVCRMYSAAVGEACRSLDAADTRAEPPDDLPLLALTHTVAPIHVRRYDAPLGAASASWVDVAQRDTFLDCGVASAWAAVVAVQPGLIGKLITEIPGAARKFKMTAYFPSAGKAFRSQVVTLDDRFYSERDGRPVFGSSHVGAAHTPASLWFALAEKAFAQVRGDDPDYLACELAYPTDVWQIFFGTRAVSEMTIADFPIERLTQELEGCRERGAPMCVSTYVDRERYKGTDLTPAHVYAVVGLVERDGVKLVQLVNPRTASAPIAPGIAGDVHLAAIDLDQVYGARHEVRGLLEIPVERLKADFDLAFWADITS